MQDVIPDLNKQELRKFGLVTGAIVAALFGLALPWLFDRHLPLWPWVLAGALCLWALILPGSLKPVYEAWMKIGSVLGWINARIILTTLYCLLILPAGFLLKLFRKDPLALRRDPEAQTYRVKSRPRPQNTLERPF